MRTYDVLFILSPQVTEEETTTLVTEFKRVAESLGATLKNEEAWGRRRLAYPIHKSTEGIYHLLVYETMAGLSELDRRMKNSDRVLRHMIVRTDEDLKRADKLAKKNPKKERVRPAAPQAYAPAAPAAAPAAPAAAAAAPAAPAPAPAAPAAAPAAPAAAPAAAAPAAPAAPAEEIVPPAEDAQA